MHHERDCLVELKPWTAVQRGELRSVDFEIDDHHRTLRSRPCISVAHRLSNFRILENRTIEIRGFFSLRIEPKKWRNSSCNGHEFVSLIIDSDLCLHRLVEQPISISTV